MVGQLGQGPVQLLLQQGGALLRGGGGLLAHIAVGAAGRGRLGADGVAPLAVVRRARALILCNKGNRREEENRALKEEKKSWGFIRRRRRNGSRCVLVVCHAQTHMWVKERSWRSALLA